MGFENRKSMRVPVSFDLFYWSEGDLRGPGRWGHVSNLSETGLAFQADEAVVAEELILLEFSLPTQPQPFRLFAQVVHCALAASGEHRHQLRMLFVNVQAEERQRLRQFVIQQGDPKLAAATGWGKAFFPGFGAIAAMYRELAPGEPKQYLEKRAFISPKEATYLKNFQGFLEASLGSRNPEGIKVFGSRPLREHAGVLLELELEQGQLHLLAEALWSHHEQGQTEAGLSLLGYQKDEAIKLEKGI